MKANLQVDRQNRPVWNDLIPLVYAGAIVGLCCGFVASAWVFFGLWDDIRLLLVVVRWFLLHGGRDPWHAWLVGRKYRDPDVGGKVLLREWAAGDFDTAQGRRNAADAAIEILLPIAAAAFGMTAMGDCLLRSSPSGSCLVSTADIGQSGGRRPGTFVPANRFQ